MKTSFPKHVKDHFLSQEEFSLHQDPNYTYLKTIPQPSPEQIGSYYETTKYLSHDDSAKGLFASMYRWVKSMNLDRKKKILQQYHQPYKTILDIGCGTGDFLAHLPSDKIKTGVEVNKKAAAIATSKNLKVYHALSQVKNTYDVITLWHVLEHLYDPETVMADLNKLLTHDGLLIIALPNYKSFDGQYYKSAWAGYDVPRHLYHYDKKALTRLLKTQNLSVVKFLPMYWDAYYVSLLSEGYLKRTLATLRAIVIASISNLSALFTKEPSSIIYIIRKTSKEAF